MKNIMKTSHVAPVIYLELLDENNQDGTQKLILTLPT